MCFDENDEQISSTDNEQIELSSADFSRICLGTITVSSTRAKTKHFLFYQSANIRFDSIRTDKTRRDRLTDWLTDVIRSSSSSACREDFIMASPPTTKKRSTRELNSIANHLLLSKTLTARTNQHSLGPMTSIENTPTYLNNGRANATTKSVDNIGHLLQFYQTLANQTGTSLPSSSSSASASPSALTSFENFQLPTATKR